MTTWLAVFAAANVSIVAGYAFAGRFLGPTIPDVRRSTRLWCGAFFGLCAYTHVHLLIHALAVEPILPADLVSWHMLVLHVLQAIAIWGFLARAGRDWGAWDSDAAR